MSGSAALDILSQGTQKRARAQLNCVACRQGKLKCNRQHPACDQCIKRNKDSSCTYLAAPQRKKPNQSMKDRIKHLENLVVELYNSNQSVASDDSPQDSTDGSNGSKTPGASPGGTRGQQSSLSGHPAFASEGDEQTKAFGRMKIGKRATTYVSPAHWEAILDNIAEVRTALDAEERSRDDQEEQSSAEPSPTSTPRVQSLLHPDPTIKMTKEDIIAGIPPKAKADAMVALFFNSTSPSSCVIHGPTFQKEYAQFWQKPEEASLAWIALLLSILSLAARVNSFDLSRSNWKRPQRGSSSPETQRLQSLCASALILAPYTKPTQYTVEALLCYNEGEYCEGDDTHLEVWLLFGVTLRLALRMGYHRDAEHTRITSFEAEMRRRSWCLLYIFDILLSFELGLPSMTLQLQFDVKLPTNLLDREFGPGVDHLPSPRPDSEITEISYMRTKMRISRVFGRAAEISHGVTATPASEVLELEKRLTQIEESFPPQFRVKPLDQCLADPRGLMVQRYNLELLIQKSRCILHRRFLTETTSAEFYDYSRNKCIGAAIRILRQLAIVDQAFEAGMMPQGWFMAALNTHDFLLGAMVIALDLDKRMKQYANDELTEDELRQNDEMRNLLEESYQIWQRPIHQSAESTKASKALLLMLTRISKTQKQKARSQPGPSDVPTTWAAQFTPSKFMAESPSLPTESTLTENLAPLMDVPASTGLTPGPMDLVDMDFAPIGNMFDVDMDWQTWDNYIFNSNPETNTGRSTDSSYEANPP